MKEHSFCSADRSCSTQLIQGHPSLFLIIARRHARIAVKHSFVLRHLKVQKIWNPYFVVATMRKSIASSLGRIGDELFPAIPEKDLISPRTATSKASKYQLLPATLLREPVVVATESSPTDLKLIFKPNCIWRPG